jgi:hypothetical protein
MAQSWWQDDISYPAMKSPTATAFIIQPWRGRREGGGYTGEGGRKKRRIQKGENTKDAELKGGYRAERMVQG